MESKLGHYRFSPIGVALSVAPPLAFRLKFEAWNFEAFLPRMLSGLKFEASRADGPSANFVAFLGDHLGTAVETQAGVDGRNDWWQCWVMPTEVAKHKATPMQVMDDLTRLSARELETVIERASVLRLQKRNAVMSARESELFRVINRGLSAGKSARLDCLQEKLRQETIRSSEHQQLLRLSDELEKLAAQRLKALIELAALRKTTVAKLMSEMGLNRTAYA